MTISDYEVAAALGAYAPEIHSDVLYDAAAKVANGFYADAEEALDFAHELTEGHTRMSFENWLGLPDSNAKIETRVEMQENFLAYKGIARRVASPLLRVTSVIPLHRMHVGSGAFAFDIRSTEGDGALFKVPRKVLDYPKRQPLTLADRAHFTEERISKLPAIPTTNFERVLAASYTGAVVTSKLSGRQLGVLRQSELEQVTDNHLEQAVTDILAISNEGIRIDGNGTNTVFDSDRGFGFFDPLSLEHSKEYCRVANLTDFAQSIALKGAYDAYAPKYTQTAQCISLRDNLVKRLGTVSANVDAEAGTIIAELDLRR